MHIPACETTELELIRFDRALEEADRPSPDYDAERWLYVPNVYSEYRYILGTRGEHPLICIGINPSTAAPDNLDNTLKSVERIALYNGFDSFLMFNVYAQRATNPDDMELTYNAQLHQENRLHIIYLAVSPNVQHHGVAEKLMDDAIHYVEKHRMMISLETHNEKNVAFYAHFGFKVFGIVEKGMGLKQYCLVREI